MARRLDSCPACRALLEPGTPVCPYCEARLRVRRHGAWGAVVNRLLQAPASAALAVAIGVFFSAEILLEQSARGAAGGLAALAVPSTLTLDRLGANAYPFLVFDKEWWRLLTAVFLHIGAIHLVFNASALVDLAPFCEKAYGTSRFLCVYLLSGLAGNLVSLLARGEAFANAGASGALCGLLGLLIVFRRSEGWDLEVDLVRRMTLRWLVFTLLFGVLIGADNYAHLGGAAAGVLLGLLLGRRPVRTSRTWTRFVWRPAAAALVLTTLGAFGAMIASQGAWQEAGRILALGQAYERLLDALDADAARGGSPTTRAALRVAQADFASHPASGPLAAARDAVAVAAGRRLEGPPPAADVPLLGARARFREAFAEAAHRHRHRIGLLEADAARQPR